MVPLPALLRSQIGRVGAFAAAAALAFGPTFLYYSRFAREDIYFAASRSRCSSSPSASSTGRAATSRR